MSDDKIEAIRAGHALYPPSRHARHSHRVAYQDIATLLAEVDRLRAERDEARAEVERMQELLRGISINMVDSIERLTRERDKARAEIERLRAENEKLREALKPFAALSLWPDDIGDEWKVNDIRSDYDWNEKENEVKTDHAFITRGHIRAARKALEDNT